MENNKDNKLTSQDLKDWQREVQNVRPRPDTEIPTIQDADITEYDDHVQTNLNIYHEPSDHHTTKPKKQKDKTYEYLNLNDSSFIDGNLAKKLRNGKLSINAYIDLHGKSQDEAIEDLINFIDYSIHTRKRCIKIITGKGPHAPEEFGVLHQNLPRWLNIDRIRPHILMFCHAQPKDGGIGAYYILLKRKR